MLLCAIRIPRPPPPATALIPTGYPIFSASADASLSFSIMPFFRLLRIPCLVFRLPGTSFKPALDIASRASTLSPIVIKLSMEGPIKVIL